MPVYAFACERIRMNANTIQPNPTQSKKQKGASATCASHFVFHIVFHKGGIPIKFDFTRFSKIAATAYPEDCQYTLDQCLDVFRCYFRTYEEYRGCPHPQIKREQISHIMREMPCISLEDRGNRLELLDPEDYEVLIALHFKTRYQHCDFNINHFFAGRVREIRLYDKENNY